MELKNEIGWKPTLGFLPPCRFSQSSPNISPLQNEFSASGVHNLFSTSILQSVPLVCDLKSLSSQMLQNCPPEQVSDHTRHKGATLSSDNFNSWIRKTHRRAAYSSFPKRKAGVSTRDFAGFSRFRWATKFLLGVFAALENLKILIASLFLISISCKTQTMEWKSKNEIC